MASQAPKSIDATVSLTTPALAAAQRTLLRHNFWSDQKHLSGQGSGGLHEKHVHFLKDFAKGNNDSGDFLHGTFHDILDAVCSFFH